METLDRKLPLAESIESVKWVPLAMGCQLMSCCVSPWALLSWAILRKASPFQHLSELHTSSMRWNQKHRMFAMRRTVVAASGVLSELQRKGLYCTLARMARRETEQNHTMGCHNAGFNKIRVFFRGPSQVLSSEICPANDAPRCLSEKHVTAMLRHCRIALQTLLFVSHTLARSTRLSKFASSVVGVSAQSTTGTCDTARSSKG
jgi:hypothetical protein